MAGAGRCREAGGFRVTYPPICGIRILLVASDRERYVAVHLASKTSHISDSSPLVVASLVCEQEDRMHHDCDAYGTAAAHHLLELLDPAPHAGERRL